MTTCPDFDKKMLLLATQVSHASENRTILLAALKALLRTMKSDQGGSEGGLVEAMTLIRCIIKLVLRLLTEPAANRYAYTRAHRSFRILTYAQAGAY